MEGRAPGDERRAVTRRVGADRWAVALIVAACAMIPLACGSSNSSQSNGSTAAKPASQGSGSPKGNNSKPAKPAPQADGQEPSAEFAGKGENGELATAGKESTIEEREAASKVVEESFAAAAASEWAKQCATFSSELVESLETRSRSKGKISCVGSLEQLAKAIALGAPQNPMTEPLAALRVNGNRAFAFFHGVGGQHFVIPLAREGGQWKLASLSPQETP